MTKTFRLFSILLPGKAYTPAVTRTRLPSFGQSYAAGDLAPSFATAFQTRHRRTGTISSSPSDTVSDIPLTRVPTEEMKRISPLQANSVYNSPHRHNASNSGSGIGMFSEADEHLDLTDSVTWRRQALVNVKDVRSIMPVSAELAQVYTLADDDPVTICGKNCQAATLHNRPDIANLWGLFGLLLARSTPYYQDVKFSHRNKKQRAAWMRTFQAALTAAGLPSFDHVVIKKEGVVSIQPEFDAKGLEMLVNEGKYTEWRRVEWGFHPFGQKLVDSLSVIHDCFQIVDSDD